MVELEVKPNVYATRLLSWRYLKHCALFFLLSVFVLRNLPVLGSLIFGLAEYPATLGGDSGRYTSGADHWIAGQPLIEKQASYLGYILVLALSLIHI